MNVPKTEAFNTMWTWLSVVMQNRWSRASVWLTTELTEARFHFTRLRAEKGDALCEYRLGLACEKGENCPRSEYDAHKWFLRAAFQGVPAAQSKVSEYFRQGRGVAQNNEEAFKWCRKAAEQGHGLSQLRLAEMYRDGIGVERNPKEATKWSSKMATQKIPLPPQTAGLSAC